MKSIKICFEIIAYACLMWAIAIVLEACTAKKPVYTINKVVVKPSGKYYEFVTIAKQQCLKPGDTAYVLVLSQRQPR